MKSLTTAIASFVRRHTVPGDHRQRADSDRGDTLIEILCALIILGLASVALILAFSTTITASATHRTMANGDVALAAAAQQAQSEIQSNISLFTSCPTDPTNSAATLASFQSLAPLVIPSPDPKSNVTITANITNVAFWNPATSSFTQTCITDQAEQITVTLVSHPSGVVFTTVFIVDYPLASSVSSSNTGTVADHLVFTNLPAATSSGTTFPSGIAFDTADQPAVAVEDAQGRLVATDLSPVILNVTSTTNGVLQSCSGNEIGGIVTFSGCQVLLNNGVSSAQFTLTASDGSLTPPVNSSQFTVVGPTPTLAFYNTPKPQASGQPFSNQTTSPYSSSQFVVRVMLGTSVQTSWSGTLSLATSGSTPSLNQLSGCSGLTTTNGVFNVTGCTFVGGYLSNSGGNVAYPYTMTASATPNTGSAVVQPTTSNAFGVTGPGSATQLAFTSQPTGVSSSSATTPFSSTQNPIVVQAEDSWGNLATGANNSVTLTINSGKSPSGTSIAETLSGCNGQTGGGASNSVTLSSGVASFTGCAATAYAQTLQLTATATGLTSATSSYFNITGVASSLVFAIQPQAGPSGTSLAVQPKIGIYDSSGFLVTGESSSVVLTTSPTTAGAVQPQLSLCSGLAPINGYAYVASCRFVGTVGTSYTMTATLATSSTTSISATSNTFTPSGAGAGTQLVFATDPVGGASGGPFSTQPVVLIEDSGGNLSPLSNVTIALQASGGSLTNCSNLTSIAGVINVAGCDFAGVEGQNYTLTATATGLSPDTSGAFTPNASGPAAQLAVTSFPSTPVSAGSPLTGVVFSIEDSYGNVVSTGPGSNDVLSVSLGANPGNVSLQPGPNDILTAVAGVVTLGGESLNTVGTYTITAVDSSETLPISSTVTSAPLTVVAAAPTAMSFTTQPGGGSGGAVWGTQPAVTLTDPYGNVALTDTSNITLSIASGPAGATLSGCTQSEASGVISFQGCSIDKAGSYTLLATDSNGAVATTTSHAFSVTIGAPKKLVFTQQPAGAVTEGAAWTTQPQVTIEDAGGNAIVTDSSTLTLSVASYSAGTSGGSTQGSIAGCVPVETAGVFNFTGCQITGVAGAGAYTIKATDSAVGVTTATSTPAFSVVAGTPSKLGYYVSAPTTGTAGSAMTNFSVAVEDASGNVITTGTGSTDTVTLSIASGPGSFNSASTTYTNVPAVGGIATFSGVVLNTSGSYTFTASDTTHVGYTAVTSTPATVINSGVGTKLVFNVQPPATGTAGTALSTFNVYVEDSLGNLVTSNTGSTDVITLTPSTGTIASGATATAVGGIATFSATTLNIAGSFTFTAGDTTHVGYATATSSPATVISPAAASKLAYHVQPPATGTAGTALTTFSVYVEDTYGNLITTGTGSTDTVTLTPSTGTIASGATATAVAGVATFSATTLNISGSYTFTAGDTTHVGYATATSTPATVIGSGVATKLAYNVQPPATGTAGTALTTFSVYVEDSNGNLVTTGTGSTDSITLTPSTGTIASGATVTAVNGVATFSATTLNIVGSYTFTAKDNTHVGYTTAVSTPATVITSGVGAKLAYNVQPPATGTAGTALTTFSVYVEDANGNLVTSNTGSTDTITLTPSTGSIASGATATAVGGVATFNATKINISGSYTFSAADTTHVGYTTAVSTPATVISPAGATKLAFNVQPPTTGTAGTALSTFSVYVEDTYGNLITTGTGSTDSITLTPSTGTIASGATAAAVGGVATFSATTLNLAGTYTFSAADTTHVGYTSAVSTPPTVIGSGVGTKLVYNVQPPATGTAGTALTAFSVYVEDANGNLVTSNTGSTDSITLTPSTGSISSGATVTAVNGVATFNATKLNLVGSYSFTASDATNGALATAVSSSPTVISPASATKLAYNVQPPATGTAGTALTTFSVYVEDTYGNLITTGTGSTDSITLTPSTGTIASGATAAASGGVATFSATKINTAGSYTFSAGDTTHVGYTTAVSTPATVISATSASKLVFTPTSLPPTTGSVNNTLSSFSVSVEDTYGNLVTTGTGSTDNILLAISTKPTGGAFKTGSTTTVAAVGGVATFSNIALTTAGPYTFTASDTTVGDTGFTAAPASATTTVFGFTGTQGTSGMTMAGITSGDRLAVLVSFYTNSTSAPTCSTPAGTALTGAAAISSTPTVWYTGTGYYGSCAYSAKLATVNGTVTEALGNNGGATATLIRIQVVEITGDTSATLPNASATNSAQVKSSATTYNLPTFTAGDSELLFAANTLKITTANGSVSFTTPPASYPSGFTSLVDSGNIAATNGYQIDANVGYGIASSSNTGTLSATAYWGSIGIDVKP